MRASLEKILPRPERSFACTEFILPAFDCPFHFHPEFEITHIVSSDGTRMVGDHIGEFQAGDLVLLGANLPHIYMSHTPPPHPRWAYSQVVQFREDCLGDAFFDVPEMGSIRALLERSARGLHFGGTTLELAVPTLERLLKASGGHRVLYLLELLHCLAEADDATPLASPGYLPNIAHSDSERLDRVCDYIYKNLQQEIDQTEVAQLLGMSASTFSRYFRKRTQITFSRFVNEVRISQACKRLLESDDTVLAISEACGFGNLSNFNRRFRELRHMTPRAFRNAFKQML